MSDNPQIVGTAGTPGCAYDVAVSGSHAYVVGQDIGHNTSGLQVIDITNPASPQIVGTLEMPYAAFAVACILSQADSPLYLLISSLIFLAGFPIGAVICNSAKKSALIEIFVAYFIFVMIILVKTLIF